MRIEPRVHDLGDGFEVRRVLPFRLCRHVGPFVFFDHIGPAELDPGRGLDVRPHPHIGLATVTYLLEGALLHRDSLGSDQVIRPGDVNWMTAGSGIVHSERTPGPERSAGHRMHGIQTWIALPKAHEEAAPAFRHHAASDLPEASQGDAVLRVIAGSAFGMVSPVAVFAPTLYTDARFPTGGRLVVPAEHEERAVHVIEGEVAVDGARVAPGSMLVLASGSEAVIDAIGAARLLLCGGAPLDGERFLWWNFVSSRRERIEQAKADWRDGRFGRVPGETESIPLPER